MKLARLTFVLTAILFLTISAFGYFFWYKPKFSQHSKDNAFAFTKSKREDNRETLIRLYQKSIPAKHYITAHGFNSRHCFLLDMRLPSGNNRFFVYNLDKDSVEIAGLVAHGSGVEDNIDTPTFSNTPNSYCTSLGKYKIGNPYNGKFGLAYKLFGLDKTNSKAFDRFVVLHAHACVPNDEVAPLPICESWGCPTVSPAFLTQLKTYLDRSEEPILLWIYY
ncbi:MAG: murein L,D-transpeptidase catalytic domain-containing protein [Ferruginibacter sp.]